MLLFYANALIDITRRDTTVISCFVFIGGRLVNTRLVRLHNVQAAEKSQEGKDYFKGAALPSFT
jgi:hypothetical protein